LPIRSARERIRVQRIDHQTSHIEIHMSSRILLRQAVALATIVTLTACAETTAPGTPTTPGPTTPVGVFTLTAAAGQALPAQVFHGIFLGENDAFYTLRYVAKSGYISIAADGRYEHRVAHDVTVDGIPTTDGNWVDRGSCSVAGQKLDCISNLNENVRFTATASGTGIEITQDLTGEGYPAAYKYARAG
jgi:hypothetical protein